MNREEWAAPSVFLIITNDPTKIAHLRQLAEVVCLSDQSVIQTLRSILPSPQQEQEIALGDHVLLMRATGSVRVGEVVLPLTRREEIVIHQLARFPGRFCSRRQLAEAIARFAPHWEANESQIPNIISALRSKICLGAGFPEIHCVRGYGYRIHW